MKLFSKCFRENFTSPLTYAAMILFFVLCGTGVTVSINDTTYSFFEIISNSELFSQAKDMNECSSFLLAYSFSQSGYYTIGLAILTAVPALYTYIRSQEKIHYYALIRSKNYRSYSAGIVLSSFLNGMIITLAGILMYTMAAFLIFPDSASSEDPYFLMAYGETVFARLFLFIKRVFNHAMVGGIIPVFAITLYRYIRSDFFAATIPMMLMYISVKVLPNWREWLNSHEVSGNALAQLFVLMFPSNLPDLGISLNRTFNAPFWPAYIVLGAFLFAIYLLFYRSVKRI